MAKIKKHITDLKKNGITILKNVLNAKECNFYAHKSDLILKKLLKQKILNSLSVDSVNIPHPFSYDKSFFKLIFFDKVDKIMSKLLDKDYVLITTSLINRKKINNKNLKGYNVGSKWHVDSHYLGGKRLDKGFSYIFILMLEDFNKISGSTLYVPRSHLFRKRPKRNANYKYKCIEGKKGSMAIIDSGLWHKGGKSGPRSRWSVFGYYASWFVKPYYRFDKLIGLKKIKKLDKKVRKLFHYNSTPPLSSLENRGTVTKF